MAAEVVGFGEAGTIYAGDVIYVLLRNDGTPLKLRHKTVISQVVCFSPELIKEMRNWAEDCVWCEGGDDISEYSDAVIVAGVNHHYVGGLREFLRNMAETIKA